MGHIGDVHTDFDIAVFKTAERQGIVEVLGVGGVDSESCHFTEVLASGDFFGCDTGVDIICGFFHVFWIAVGQVVFGEDGVDFAIVVARTAKNVKHFAMGILRVHRPRSDSHHGFVARSASAKRFARNEYVACEIARVGFEKGELAHNVERSDKCLLFWLDDFHNFGFSCHSATVGGYNYLHTVAVECVHGFAVVDGINGLFAVRSTLVDNYEILAVGASGEDSFDDVGF